MQMLPAFGVPRQTWGWGRKYGVDQRNSLMKARGHFKGSVTAYSIRSCLIFNLIRKLKIFSPFSLLSTLGSFVCLSFKRLLYSHYVWIGSIYRTGKEVNFFHLAQHGVEHPPLEKASSRMQRLRRMSPHFWPTFWPRSAPWSTGGYFSFSECVMGPTYISAD